MKRCWVGAGLLALFLVLGLISVVFLSRFGESLSRETAQVAALADTDRAQAEQILHRARQQWERKRFLLAVLSDHEPIREADTLFLLLQNPGDTDDFRENALRLSRIFQQLGQSQLPKWENIL